VIAQSLCKDEAQMAIVTRNYLKTVSKSLLEKYGLESAVVVEEKKEPSSKLEVNGTGKASFGGSVGRPGWPSPEAFIMDKPVKTAPEAKLDVKGTFEYVPGVIMDKPVKVKKKASKKKKR